MDFNLTDEQIMLQEMAHKFAVAEFTPIAKECDREERFPREVWKKACQAGLIGAMIPEAYGGVGAGFLENALITEQFTRVDMGIGSIGAATFGSENIVLFGTEEQKKKYLPPLVRGEAISAGAYTEPDAGTDVAGIKTTAKKDGNDYVINGSKMFITNGTICDFMVVLCVTNPEAEKRHRRQSLIIVEADRPGITRTKIHGKMGIRASDTAEIVFEDVHVPRSNLIGEEGKGFYEVMQFFDVTRIMVAAQGVGVAQGALEMAIKYTQERKTFGAPIIANQAVQFKLAEMATRIELARTLNYRAAWQIDQGKTDPKLNAMAKYYSGEMAIWVTNEALQLHGGYGYIDEYDIQRFYRDARILEIYEGVRDAELMTIARRLF
ncbi:acryloyl-CoA reductase [bacterium BMS3Abin05]|nr:acryloyl-CoA reductase [bacterium BMS3Abin05]GBE26924.1 acryloyl-CoA reductase [bacterium BMS3Bbin03]HDZ11615.1 acyl-CoA dehydrogenase [Bacteroidota bacterium]